MNFACAILVCNIFSYDINENMNIYIYIYADIDVGFFGGSKFNSKA